MTHHSHSRPRTQLCMIYGGIFFSFYIGFGWYELCYFNLSFCVLGSSRQLECFEGALGHHRPLFLSQFPSLGWKTGSSPSCRPPSSLLSSSIHYCRRNVFYFLGLNSSFKSNFGIFDRMNRRPFNFFLICSRLESKVYYCIFYCLLFYMAFL